MTIFNLEKEVQGEWFPFFGSKFDPATGEITYEKPEENAAEFCIRSMITFWEERRKDRKKEYKFIVNPTTRAMERVGYYPDLPPAEEARENEDAWDYVITGIRNAFMAQNVPIECTRENKLKLLKMPVFMRYIQRVFQILSEAEIKQNEAASKN